MTDHYKEEYAIIAIKAADALEQLPHAIGSNISDVSDGLDSIAAALNRIADAIHMEGWK